MGIKFHCPQGHKLNVKSFLAGKKGVCPKCGTRVRIPLESEPGLKDSDVEEEPGALEAAGNSLPRSGNGSPAALADKPPQPAARHAEAHSPVASDNPQAVAVAAPPASGPPPDPIAEAPSAFWYVRPPSGGEYGPARGDIMRKWIAEGRVSSDSLVWREGWPEWRSAGEYFPDLQAVSAPAVAAPANTAIPYADKTVNRYQNKQRSTSGLAIAALVGLGVLCAVLLVVLALVLFAK